MKVLVALLSLICLFPLGASADVLLVEAISAEPSNSPTGLPRPHRGMTMDHVRQRFGTPKTEFPWVGEPPITRWEYPNYTVYFEQQYVLTSVIHR